MNQFQHIVSNQGILGGKPCIRGIDKRSANFRMGGGWNDYSRNLRQISSLNL